MEKKNKRSIIIGVTVILLVTLTLLGLTYAYYRTRIVGNPNEQSLSVTSKKLEITYSDGELITPTDGFEPGKTITKSFSVENTGEGKVTYVVYLEDVVNTFKRYEDLEMTLMLNGTDVSENSHYPRIDGIITTQEIDVDEVQNYTLTIYYKNEPSINQSEDMGKTISGKLQLYDITNTVKEGTLSSKILANAKAASEDGLNAVYRAEPLSLPAQETTTIQEQKVGSNKTISLTDGLYYTYAAEVEFNPLSGYSLVNPEVDTWADIKADPVKLANFKYLRRESGVASIPEERTNTIKDMVEVVSISDSTMTYRMLELTPTEESVEKTLSATRDDYGISYYYRGDVNNNYVNYNGMCWRIVRIEGDGSIKLSLASSVGECNSANLTDSSSLIYMEGAHYGYYFDETNKVYIADYINGPDYQQGYHLKSMRKVLNDWSADNKFDTSELKAGDWCLGNVEDAYNYSAPYNKLVGQKASELILTQTQFLYESYARLYRQYPESTTLECGEGLMLAEDYVATLTVDEMIYSGSKIGYLGSANYLLMNTGIDVPLNWILLTKANVSLVNGYYRDNVFFVRANALSFTYVHAGTSFNFHFKPVISLNNSSLYNNGNGSLENPYTIKEA